jgi:hypothetical protein
MAEIASIHGQSEWNQSCSQHIGTEYYKKARHWSRQRSSNRHALAVPMNRTNTKIISAMLCATKNKQHMKTKAAHQIQ